jgi:hypothetical protein
MHITILFIIATLASLAAIAFLLNRKSEIGNRQSLTACNIAEGTRELGRLTMFGDGLITQRYSLVKYGSSATNCALITADTDQVLGIADDEISDTSVPIAIHLLGAVKGTQRVFTNFAVTHNNMLVADGATAGAKPAPAAGRGIQWGGVTLAAGKITAVAVIGGGSGCVQGQPVLFQDANGSGATGYLNVAAGAATSVTITNGGSGYTAPVPSAGTVKYQRLGIALQDTAGGEVIEFTPLPGDLSI